jgi:hypothetical protein
MQTNWWTVIAFISIGTLALGFQFPVGELSAIENARMSKSWRAIHSGSILGA